MVVLTVAVASTYGVTIAGPRNLRAASRVAAASSVVWASRDGGMLRHGAGTGMPNAAVLVQGGRYGRSLLIVTRSIFNTLSAMCARALRSAAFPLNHHRDMGTRLQRHVVGHRQRPPTGCTTWAAVDQGEE